MTAENEILKILEENNPFSSNAAGDPREDRYPDVPGLGDEAFHGVKALIAFRKNNPAKQCAGAVTGEAGTGKTHLIGRLIDDCANERTPYYFAYIYPFIDPHQGFRYLLREIVVNLAGKYKNGRYSQLDLLSANVGIYVVERFSAENSLKKTLAVCQNYKAEPSRFFDQKFKSKTADGLVDYGMNFLCGEYPSITPDFLKVVLRYCFVEETRLAARQWLMGRSLEPEQAGLLEVGDRSSKSAEALEEEAQEIVLSLDALFHLRKQPMVVFFDQLENIGAGEQIQTFQKMIFLLGDKCKAMLPVAFFRGQDWQAKFSQKMDDFCLGRFKANLFDLKGCDRNQALELIRSRLNHALAGIETPNDLYPFHPDHKDDLDRMLNLPEMHPRQVINRANRLLHKISHGGVPQRRDESQIIKDAFKTRYEEVLANNARYSPDESRLTLALKLYLENRPDDFAYRVSDVNVSDERNKYIDIFANATPKGEKPIPVVFMIDVELNHASVGASLKRGIGHMKKNPGGRAVYVRDGRCPFYGPERWKQTNALKDEFADLGGEFVLLGVEQSARLYALALLKFEIEAGDVVSDTGSPVDIKLLGQFIAEMINGNTYPVFAPFDEYLSFGKKKSRKNENPKELKSPAPPEDANPEAVVRRALKILEESPTKMMKADLLAEKISKNTDDPASTDRVVLILGERKDRFRIFRAKDGVIVSLKGT